MACRTVIRREDGHTAGVRTIGSVLENGSSTSFGPSARRRTGKLWQPRGSIESVIAPLPEVPPYLREIARASPIRLNEDEKRVVFVKERDRQCLVRVDAGLTSVAVQYSKRAEHAPSAPHM